MRQLIVVLCILSIFRVAHAELPDYMQLVEENDFTGWSFYTHEGIDLIAGTRSNALAFFPYIGVHEDGTIALRGTSDYTGSDWIFFESVQYVSHTPEGEKLRGSYEVSFGVKQTEVLGANRVNESADIVIAARNPNDDTLEEYFINEELLAHLLAAETLNVRLWGERGVKDAEFSAEELLAIQETVLAYLGVADNAAAAGDTAEESGAEEQGTTETES